jgi:hypothetical protein
VDDPRCTPVPEPPDVPWSLHDEPGRALDEHVGVCSCVTCEAALIAQAASRPAFPVALRTEADRIVVTLEYLVETMRVDPTLAPLLYVGDDRVRSMYVPVDPWRMRGRRWWSRSCHEDEDAAARRHPRHRVAKRQSALARRQAVERIRAASPPVPPAEVEFASLAEVIAPHRHRHGKLIAQIRAHALAQGQSLDADVVALVLVAGEHAMAADRRLTVDRWIRRDVIDLLSVDVFNWCSLHRILLPEQVPEAIWHLLGLLAASGALDAASDPLNELRKPLRCYGGLGADGRRRDDDADRLRCECYVTYRGPSYGELRNAGTSEVTA